LRLILILIITVLVNPVLAKTPYDVCNSYQEEVLLLEDLINLNANKVRFLDETLQQQIPGSAEYTYWEWQRNQYLDLFASMSEFLTNEMMKTGNICSDQVILLAEMHYKKQQDGSR